MKKSFGLDGIRTHTCHKISFKVLCSISYATRISYFKGPILPFINLRGQVLRFLKLICRPAKAHQYPIFYHKASDWQYFRQRYDISLATAHNFTSEICHFYLVKWTNWPTLKNRKFFLEGIATQFLVDIDPQGPK